MITSNGVFIVLLGPDGCGKSTIARHLIKKLNNPKILHFHWRPNLIPQLRKQKSIDINGAPPPAPDDFAYGYFVSFLRYIYYYTDFYLGYWFIIRRKRANGYYIIGERWYLDVLIHPARYGFKLPAWILKLGNALLPSPDHTFLLSAEPVAIHNRKPELTIAQIQDQLTRMTALVNNTKNGSVIDTGSTIDDSVNSILTICGIDNAK